VYNTLGHALFSSFLEVVIMKRLFPESKIYLIPTTGTYPKGFLAGGTFSKVKKQYNDIAVVYSPLHPCHAAAVFTTNKFSAAPVQVSKKIIQDHGYDDIFGILVNSGCANACTGEQGITDALKISGLFSRPSLVMSTGVIGQPLQMEKVIKGFQYAVQHAGSSHEDWMEAAEGIMTTDTFPKLVSREFTTGSGSYRMAGWSKGAGMIHPNMATMLSAIFTDANISPELLTSAVHAVADKRYSISYFFSFNAISIDGDTSTNDTFAVLANKAADMNPIHHIDQQEFKEFQENLTLFAIDLAKLIVRDGEGATKFLTVKITVIQGLYRVPKRFQMPNKSHLRFVHHHW
jgi:glutamate N-acetyltransferase/amino-acid N-acetyltransferase